MTLIELLAVMAILGILVALMVPAVGALRETARRAQCTNHIRQLTIAATLHLGAHSFFPSGGWSDHYTADPHRGYGKSQPGGWLYSLLEYLEESTLHSYGRGETGTPPPGLVRLHESAPALFYCPSRRAARPYPLIRSDSMQPRAGHWILAEAPGLAQLPGVTKSDFAANSGDALHHAANDFGSHNDMWWPKNYQALSTEAVRWTVTNNPRSVHYQTGVVYYRSEISPRHITDGLSNTYLFGEKFMNPATYVDINLAVGNGVFGDNQSAWTGYDWDNHRVAWQENSRWPSFAYQPQQDHGRSWLSTILAFGSAHAGSLNMSYCDGSVRSLNYDIDHSVHRRQANRLDHRVVTHP